MKAVYEYADSLNLQLNDYQIQRFAEMIMRRCASACNNSKCGRELSAQDLIAEEFSIDVDCL